MLKRLLIQASHYFTGSFFMLIAGLISFPILTRLLTVGDYGVMALVSSILAALSAIGKSGIQHSIVRYYSEIRAGKQQWTLTQFYGTVVLGMGGIAFAVAIVYVTIVICLPEDWFEQEKLKYVLLLAAPILILEVLGSAFQNILVAQERTIAVNLWNVICRYLQLSLTVLILFFLSRDVLGFFSAILITSVIFVVGAARLVLRNNRFALRDYDWPLQKEMLLFGIPLVGVELSNVLIMTTDNYVIQWMLGSNALGPYAAAYNFSNYIKVLLVSALIQPVRPLYMRIYADNGVEETKRFVASALHTYVLIGAPMAFGALAIGPELLVLLSSGRYIAGGEVVPYTVAALVVTGVVPMLSAGLDIEKKSMVRLKIIVFAAMLNLVLNLILIPQFGIKGAAIATLITSVTWVFVVYKVAKRYFEIVFPWRAVFNASAASMAMLLVIRNIQHESTIIDLSFKMFFGGLIYLMLVAILDSLARRTVQRCVSEVIANGKKYFVSR